MNILDSFVTFLFYLSVVFIPVAGVIIVDHFIARPEAYRVTEVEDNQPLNRWGYWRGSWALRLPCCVRGLHWQCDPCCGAGCHANDGGALLDRCTARLGASLTCDWLRRWWHSYRRCPDGWQSGYCQSKGNDYRGRRLRHRSSAGECLEGQTPCIR